MAEADIARTEIADYTILDEGLSLEIEVEVPGWTERIAIPTPGRPGAVKVAVEKVLRDLGLPKAR